jgi:hypothetical protein
MQHAWAMTALQMSLTEAADTIDSGVLRGGGGVRTNCSVESECVGGGGGGG